MIGIVLVTHGHLAEEMLRTLRGVLGLVARVEAVSAVDDPDLLAARIRQALALVDEGEGSLILTDMLGDTATNLSLAVSHELSAEVVAGVNMPMLVKAVTCRGAMPLRELAAFIEDYGRSHIFWATDLRPRIHGARR